ncbi:MAG: methyltransferase domain-containing protein [Terracidiphilus sp.]
MDSSAPEIDPAISEFYQATAEESRLQHGAFQLEGLRTRELIQRHIPDPPAVVFDVGGAAGAYALWLAAAGYSVHLIDPVELHVHQAQQRSSGNARPLASCQLGDARKLAFANESAEIALLLGPLYHLPLAEERARALAEAARVLRPGGILFAAAISRWASVLDGMARDLFEDPAFLAIVEQDVKDGQHRNVAGRLDYFTTAYFHRPEDLRAEVTDSGLEIMGLYGIEGPGWILPDIAERLADLGRRENLLRAARFLESEPSMVAASAHMLAVARKPR